jgi:hypothetical protein
MLVHLPPLVCPCFVTRFLSFSRAMHLPQLVDLPLRKLFPSTMRFVPQSHLQSQRSKDAPARRYRSGWIARTVQRPKRFPVKSPARQRYPPQLVDLPLYKFDPITTRSAPQSHLQSQRTRQ